MTRAVDGPCQGTLLMLKHAPMFLRFVKHQLTGAVDALDAPGDTAEVLEDVFAYVRVGAATAVHIRARRGGGFYRGGDYRFIAPQPSSDVLRDNTAWQRWVEDREATAS